MLPLKIFLCALDLTVLLKDRYLPLELCWMSFKFYHLCVGGVFVCATVLHGGQDKVWNEFWGLISSQWA